jgi:2-C-methyl-D-erythritol 4-phosphate cytidylyltransferase
LLEWSLAAFEAADSVDGIVVAVPPGQEGRLSGRDADCVTGGDSRSASVAAALARVSADLVVVHDAARPLVTPELVDGVVAQLREHDGIDGVVAAAPATDTIKRVGPDSEVVETLTRGELWAAQTPQAFRTQRLREALADRRAIASATDDAMLVERLGGRVAIHPVPDPNPKLTSTVDLRLCELLLAERG